MSAHFIEQAERDMAAMNRAFEGYTGPLDAVRPGDFAEALRLLDMYVRDFVDPRDHETALDFLARLQPEDTS